MNQGYAWAVDVLEVADELASLKRANLDWQTHRLMIYGKGGPGIPPRFGESVSPSSDRDNRYAPASEDRDDVFGSAVEATNNPLAGGMKASPLVFGMAA